MEHTGVSPELYQEMVAAIRSRTAHVGRPEKLSVEDQLLLTIQYWKDKRIQYDLALEYGISEPTCSRIIRKVESVLRDGFSLQQTFLSGT